MADPTIGAFQSAWLTLPQPSRLAKSIDGARTDVQDISSLVYYPIDPTVPFHETIHSCDLYQEPYKNQPLSDAFNEIMKVCTGYKEK